MGLLGLATFQEVMNTILAPVLRKFVVMFIDDVLIYSSSWQEHLQHLEAVFKILQQNWLYVKLSKCSFAKHELSYLGRVISPTGVSTDPKKIQIIADWPVPKSVKVLRSFLGMAGYYQKYLRNFTIGQAIDQFTEKGVVYVWTSETEASLQTLKTTLMTAPVLAQPDFSKTFVLETDASDKGIGAVLL